MAWTRLGVPQEWAQFLIQLDLEDTTTVRLPIPQQAHDLHGMDGLHDYTHSGQRTSSSRQREEFHKAT